jgi:hypothetical protein
MQIPEVVAAFLREVELLRTPELHINPLSPEEAAQQSTDLAKTSIFGELLGLIVLDDANDSNPYCYISRGLGAGMVVHHEHDGTVAVRYPDLVSFGEALRDAVVGGDDIRDLRPARCKPHPDQAGLRAELRTRLTGKDPDAEPFSRLFLPLLDPSDVETLELAAAAHDFFIRESAGEAMARNPLPQHLPIATRLAVDPHPQVRTPARRVLVMLKAPLPPPTLRRRYEDDGQRPRTALGVSMIDLPEGMVRLVIDDLRRQGSDAPFGWSTKRFVFHLDVDMGALHRGQLDMQRLVDVGINVLGLLSRQRREDGLDER